MHSRCCFHWPITGPSDHDATPLPTVHEMYRRPMRLRTLRFWTVFEIGTSQVVPVISHRRHKATTKNMRLRAEQFSGVSFRLSFWCQTANASHLSRMTHLEHTFVVVIVKSMGGNWLMFGDGEKKTEVNYKL